MTTNARTFNGTSDVIKAALTSSPIATLTAPATWAGVIRKNADAVNGVIARLNDSTGAAFYGGLQFNSSNFLRFFGASATASSAFTVTSAEGWILVAGSKASGTVKPRFHKLSAGTWTHSDGDVAATDVGSVGSAGLLWFGANGSPIWLNGDIAAVAVWNSVLTDGQVETLGVSFRQWLALQPTGMWMFDQASTATTVTDVTGNGTDQTAIAGTSIAGTQPAVPVYGQPGPAATGVG